MSLHQKSIFCIYYKIGSLKTSLMNFHLHKPLFFPTNKIIAHDVSDYTILKSGNKEQLKMNKTENKSTHTGQVITQTIDVKTGSSCILKVTEHLTVVPHIFVMTDDREIEGGREGWMNGWRNLLDDRQMIDRQVIGRQEMIIHL